MVNLIHALSCVDTSCVIRTMFSWRMHVRYVTAVCNVMFGASVDEMLRNMIVLAILLMIMPLRNTNELLSTINRPPFPRAVRI